MRKLLTGMSDCVVAVIKPNGKTKVVLLLLEGAMSMVLLHIGCANLGLTAGSQRTELILFLSALLG